jgi:hypothetical protein
MSPRPPTAIGERSPAESSERRGRALDSAERAMRICPICGRELEERKCKLFCPRPGCGYFLSCADFY